MNLFSQQVYRENNMKSCSRNPDAESLKYRQSGCLVYCVAIFLAIIGLSWLISGEIIIPYKGIYIIGLPARLIALLWIGVSIGLSFPRRPKSG